MTKRIRRLSDMELVACENDLRHLDDMLEQLDKDDPANEARIDELCRYIAQNEEWALSKPPQSVHGLATQARIARRSCDWAEKILVQMDRLIEAIHTIPDVSIRRSRIKLRANRSYRRRSGEETGPLLQMDSRGLMFSDDFNSGIWEANGRSTGGDRKDDLVEEVTTNFVATSAPRVRPTPTEIEHRVAA